MHKKIIMFFMILICIPVSAMEPTDEIINPNPPHEKSDDFLILESDHEQSAQEQFKQASCKNNESDNQQPNLTPQSNPAFFVRPYRNGWQLTTSLVGQHQIKNTPIFQAKRAIEANNTGALKIILDSKVFDFTPQENQLTSISFALLKCAIKARNPHICELLLQAGADANASSIEEDEGNNILSVACRRAFFPRMHQNVYKICKILLTYGSKINKRCIVEAENERGFLLPLFVRHILTQPNGSVRPDIYVRGFEGRSPIYLKNLEQLAALVEEPELLEAFGGLFKSIQPKNPFFLYGLTELFKDETSHLYFPSEYYGTEHAKCVQDAVKDLIVATK